MSNQFKYDLNKHMNNTYPSIIYNDEPQKALFNKQNIYHMNNSMIGNNINSNIKDKNIFMRKTTEKKKFNKILDINSIYNDDSLANNFSFKLSIYDNTLNAKDKYKKMKKLIYGKSFNDDKFFDIKNNSIFSFFNPDKNKSNKNEVNFKELSLLQSNNIKLNFGEDPNKIYKNLNGKINEGFFTNEVKDDIFNFIKNISNFPIFKYQLVKKKENNNDKINQAQDNKYTYYNSSFVNNINIFSKYIYPVRYINNVQIIILNNKLVKRNSNKSNYDSLTKKKTIPKINNGKSLKYKSNNKIIINLDEICFEEDDNNIKNRHYLKKIKRNRNMKYCIRLKD